MCVSLGLAAIYYSNCTLQTKPIMFSLSFSVPVIPMIPMYFASLLLKNLETLVPVVQTKLRLVNTKLTERMFFPFGDRVSRVSSGLVQGCADEHSAKGCMHTYLVSNPEKFQFITLLSRGRIVAKSSGQELAALILSLPTVPCFTYTLLSKFSRCWSWDATDNSILLWFILRAGPILCRKGGRKKILPVCVMRLFHNAYTQDSQMGVVQTCYFQRYPNKLSFLLPL